MNNVLVVIQTCKVRGEERTYKTQTMLVRQLPHDKPVKVGQRLFGGKVIDIQPEVN